MSPVLHEDSPWWRRVPTGVEIAVQGPKVQQWVLWRRTGGGVQRALARVGAQLREVLIEPRGANLVPVALCAVSCRVRNRGMKRRKITNEFCGLPTEAQLAGVVLGREAHTQSHTQSTHGVHREWVCAGVGVFTDTQETKTRTAGRNKGGAPARQVVLCRREWLVVTAGLWSKQWVAGNTPETAPWWVVDTHAGASPPAATPAMMRQRTARHKHTHTRECGWCI